MYKRQPIAYVEATNFTINGEDGYDGYSQSTNPALWDCYDDATKSACDRDSETQWGKIWHTEHDRLDKMAELFPGRIEQQLGEMCIRDSPCRVQPCLPVSIRRCCLPSSRTSISVLPT